MIRVVGSGEAPLAAVRALMDAAFGDRFTDDDWDHTVGGTHVLWEEDGAVVAHASVVARRIEVGDRILRCGYVEGVATVPHRQGEGLGSAVMAVVNGVVREGFELGMLSTSRTSFYERLGWQRWQGPSYVRRAGGVERTEDEDDGLLALPVIEVDVTLPITCEERAGDDW